MSQFSPSRYYEKLQRERRIANIKHYLTLSLVGIMFAVTVYFLAFPPF